MKPPLHARCRLLQSHPCGLLAVEKAAGVLSHPNPRSKGDRHSSKGDRHSSLIPLPYDYEREAYKDGEQKWYLLNRLDGPTSGVLLLAENQEVRGLALEAFAQHRVEKTYLAIVKGIPRRQRDRWSDHLVVRRSKGQLRTMIVPGRPNAHTRMCCRRKSAQPPAYSLLELSPETGRTHQLRVQCAARHLPILGDATYGDFRFNREMGKGELERRLYLHSWKVKIQLELSGLECEFRVESAVPECFTVALP